MLISLYVRVSHLPVRVPRVAASFWLISRSQQYMFGNKLMKFTVMYFSLSAYLLPLR